MNKKKRKEKKKVAATARGEIRTQDRMGTKLKDIIMLTGPYCKISFTHLRVQTWADINQDVAHTHTHRQAKGIEQKAVHLDEHNPSGCATKV